MEGWRPAGSRFRLIRLEQSVSSEPGRPASVLASQADLMTLAAVAVAREIPTQAIDVNRAVAGHLKWQLTSPTALQWQAELPSQHLSNSEMSGALSRSLGAVLLANMRIRADESDAEAWRRDNGGIANAAPSRL
jgi:hypothetical protein